MNAEHDPQTDADRDPQDAETVGPDAEASVRESRDAVADVFPDELALELESSIEDVALDDYALGGAILDAEGEGSDIDIEAALASVASLSDVMAEQEAAEAAEIARREDIARRDEETAAMRQAYYLPRPPVTLIQRGQLASTAPAIALIAIGSWLTFALSALDEGESLSASAVTLVVSVGLSVTLLAYWLNTRRWGRGSAFVAFGLIFSAAVIYYLSESNQTLGADGYPLVLSAFGLSALLSGAVSQPRVWGQMYTGLASVVAGIVGLAVSTSALDDSVIDVLQTIGVAAVIIIIGILLSPYVLKKRT